MDAWVRGGGEPGRRLDRTARTGADTVVYETTDQIGPDDVEGAKRWAGEYLAKAIEDQDVDVEWEPHRPGPGTTPDFYTARIDDAP